MGWQDAPIVDEPEALGPDAAQQPAWMSAPVVEIASPDANSLPSNAPVKADTDAFDAARDVAWQAPQGLNEGLDSFVNAPYNIGRAALGAFGVELPQARNYIAETFNSGVQPEGAAGRIARTAGEVIGSSIPLAAVPFAAAARPAMAGAQPATSAIGAAAQDAVNLIRADPTAALKAEVAANVGSGAAVGGAREADLGPAGEMVAALAGGIAPVSLMRAPRLPEAPAEIWERTAAAPAAKAVPDEPAPLPTETPPTSLPAASEVAQPGIAGADPASVNSSGAIAAEKVAPELPPAPRYVRPDFQPEIPERPTFSPQPTREEILAAAERQDVTIPRAAVAGDNTQMVAGRLASLPVVGAPLQRASREAVDQMQQARDRLQTGLGAEVGPIVAGNTVGKALGDWLATGSKDITRAAYEPVKALVKPDVLGELTHTRQLIDDFKARAKASTSTAYKPIEDFLGDALARPDGLTFEGLKDLRHDAGEMLASAKIAGDKSQKLWEATYKQMTKDLRQVTRRAGGNKALAAFDEANLKAAEIADQRDRLAEIVGATRGDPNAGPYVTEKLIAMARQGRGEDLGTLQLAKRTAGDEAWNSIAGEAVARLGRGPKTDFSAERFLTEYGKMSANGKLVMFGRDNMGALDDLATLATQEAKLRRMGNPSGTAGANYLINFILSAGGSLAAIHAPGAALGGLAGTVGSAAIGRGIASHLARPAAMKRAAPLARAAANLRQNDTKAGRLQFNLALRSFAAAISDITGDDETDIAQSVADGMARGG